MTISAIAKTVGLTVKSIHCYESVGLILSPQRSENDYRNYDETHIPGLRLIREGSYCRILSSRVQRVT
ncbi:MerR family transcriptional regulator [Ferrimonas sediminum]|uniref:MerR family transcriptional regulator n=1 Tax=Ferrimonas sediminum TaxID=718193 RepID=UPI0015A4CA09